MKNVLSVFDREDFHPKNDVFEAVYTFAVWALPAFIFVIWANTYYPEVEFYQKAIKEGIGPNLWNTIGSFGLFSFGVAIGLSSFKIPSVIAKQILSNTYAIGCLTFGLLVGQWYFLSLNELVWWQQGLFGITSVFLLGVVFIYNTIIWYLGFLVGSSHNQKSAFILKFETIHIFWRIGFGAFISCVSILVFLNA